MCINAEPCCTQHFSQTLLLVGGGRAVAVVALCWLILPLLVFDQHVECAPISANDAHSVKRKRQQLNAASQRAVSITSEIKDHELAIAFCCRKCTNHLVKSCKNLSDKL
jgi:hypothetical protein